MRAPVEQRLGMAGDLRPRHREAHRAEEAARPALADVALRLLVGRGRGGADHVEAELVVPPGAALSAVMRGCAMLKAVASTRTAGLRFSVSRRSPTRSPGPGEVVVRAAAAALNHLDVWVRKGLPSVPKPRILGADGAGVVEASGTASTASRSGSGS